MNKVAVITGSSGGIGRALVDAYLIDNYYVVGVDTISSGLTSDLFLEIITDLSEFAKNENYRKKLLDEIKILLPRKFDTFILINNAAVQILNPISDIHWKDWENTLSVNMVAPFFLVQGFMEALIASQGHVINISSIHSKLTKKHFSCYAASKAALEALTRSLALELSPKAVSVNAIAPAAISTDMIKDGFRDTAHKLQELESYHPSGSIGSPEQLANFVKSITDHKSGFLTGSVLEFNGGIGGKLHDPGS
jgi:NAD(P)-dependent dehydrogenase (short-subunit alcohol dehydrogenase family)